MQKLKAGLFVPTTFNQAQIGVTEHVLVLLRANIENIAFGAQVSLYSVLLPVLFCAAQLSVICPPCMHCLYPNGSKPP
jgi:hypothetical protein